MNRDTRAEIENLDDPKKITFRLSCGARIQGFLYVPPHVKSSAPVLVSVHGISRNARQHIQKYKKYADDYKVILFAPKFSIRKYSGYQRLWSDPIKLQSDLVLLELIEKLGRYLHRKLDKFHLFGFSGGAQFAHRFALLHPDRLNSLMLCSAGWYTEFDNQRAFPYGLQTSSRYPAIRAKLTEFLEIPQCVAVGRWDIYQDTALRNSRRLNKSQGFTRLQRAHWWVNYLNQHAHQQGLPPVTELVELPKCGHRFVDAVQEGGLGELVFKFMFPKSSNAYSPSLPESSVLESRVTVAYEQT